MKLSIRFTLAGAAFLAASAAPGSVAAQATKVADTTTAKHARQSADLITQEQLASRTFSNAYTAIESLRSNWLRVRNMNPPTGSVINPGVATGSTGSGGTTATSSSSSQGSPKEATGIQVYIDGTRLGGIETLKTIPIQTVYSIRRISGTDAQARFGIGHSDGVIFVATGPNKGGA